MKQNIQNSCRTPFPFNSISTKIWHLVIFLESHFLCLFATAIRVINTFIRIDNVLTDESIFIEIKQTILIQIL